MSLTLLRKRIKKCQIQLILYIVLAVGLFSVNMTRYGTMMNQQFISSLKYSKEYIGERKESQKMEQGSQNVTVEVNEEVSEQISHMEETTPEKESVTKMSVESETEPETEEVLNAIGSIYIQMGSLNVREIPNGEIIGEVYFGEKYDYYEVQGNWVKIAYDDTFGYVYKVYGDIYDTEGNLIAAAELPKPAPEPEPEPNVTESTPQVVVAPSKEPSEMTNSELYQWVLAQIITPDMDEFARVRAVNQYLCDHMTYDINYYSSRDAILLGRGRCQGYANAFKNLMNALGIPTDYIRGYADGDYSSTHAWNRVLIQGVYYYVDVTWNDTTGRNSYLLIGEEEFNRDRSVIEYNPYSE